ncbi:Heat shock chaperonin-binding protein (plasmid) [Oscillatoria nigro-viridis PCC 7112]|uniref:Heat shock chaperonin-binding protein n=1 Tax=Phormidium nigroviride PCC 7112 TaxID=179408 RepID=K9VTU5_9CYAN|nr:DUF4157 domain-containing protein [Oscillatoria nigro-viridis]AFZ10984.1 Heat shock chaperonin-binding protein [Oscillatoria nigro-viridis PCC 7112]
MEHQRIQRTSSWSPTFTKRDTPSNDEPPKTVQKKTAPASQPQQSLVDRSPEPSYAMQQDPVMMRILANNPVVRQIFQQYSQPGVATQDKDSNDAVQKQTAPAAPAEQSLVDRSPEPSDAMQQDPVMMRILANNPTVRQIFQQQKQPGEKSSESKIQQVAAKGFSGSSTSLPHQNQLQQSFGVDLSDVQAYIGGEAATACQQIGAQAYASGNQIAFKEQPSLELAAHEAAHVVQQASGKVQLAGGVGKVGDKYENHADAVAAKVVAGESAAPLENATE